MVIFAFGLRGLVRNILQLVDSVRVRHGPTGFQARWWQSFVMATRSDKKAFDSLADGRN